MGALSPAGPTDEILCLNVGTSSVKAARYTRSGSGDPALLDQAERPAGPDSINDLLQALLAAGPPPAVVAHRVVHGGPDLVEHTIVDDAVRATLEGAVPFAPLHLPHEIAAIDAIGRRYPQAAQVVCFDTAFHRTMPEAARRLALPAWVHDEGVERYGFHGLSYEFVVDHVGADLLGRAVVAHLGSGASLAAIAQGRSVDTTMGLTPTGGVVMATRSGDLDPGVLLHLARRHGLDADALEHLVDQQSGLLGLSGSTGDMQELLEERRAGDDVAALTVDVFCRSVRKAVGALAAVLAGVDTLVFTAGIGEHAPEVRALICSRLGHLGVVVDPVANRRGDPVISPPQGRVAVRVVHTDENLMIARHAARLTR